MNHALTEEPIWSGGAVSGRVRLNRVSAHNGIRGITYGSGGSTMLVETADNCGRLRWELACQDEGLVVPDVRSALRGHSFNLSQLVWRS
jgi:hypothetical protein